MHPSNRILIACEVFRQEILAFLSEEKLAFRQIEWLEMGLHDQPDLLRSKMQNRIQDWEDKEEVSRIYLAYGCCGSGLVGVRSEKKTIIIPKAHDCISILLGGPKPHSELLKKNPGTYFYTPGWIHERRVPGPDRENWLRKKYQELYPDDPEYVDDLIDVDKEIFGQHNCAACINLVNDPETENYSKACAKHLGWSYQKLKGDRTLLMDLLRGPKSEDDRFVFLNPGHYLGMDSEGLLTATKLPSHSSLI